MPKQNMQPDIPGLFNVSYFEKEVNEEVIRTVGRPFGVFKNLKMGGPGSPRMIIDDASPAILPLLAHDKYLKYCNIELRPEGIIVRFRIRQDALAFVVGYADLNIVKDDSGFQLVNGKEFIHLVPFKNTAQVHAFFIKLENQRILTRNT